MCHLNHPDLSARKAKLLAPWIASRQPQGYPIHVDMISSMRGENNRILRLHVVLLHFAHSSYLH